MKYVLKSEANGMKVFILNCISEHLGFSFFKDTIVDMWTRSEIVINTGRNGFNTKSNSLFFSKVIFIFAFKNSHSLEWTWTHSGEWKIRITDFNKKDTFPKHWSYISEDLRHHIHRQSNMHQGNLDIDKVILRLRQRMNWLLFVFRYLIFGVPNLKIGISLRIEYQQLYRHRNSKCLVLRNGFFHSFFQLQLILQ